MDIDLRVASPVAVFLALIGASWRTSRLKADLIDRWRQRIDVAEVDLTETALEELRGLRTRIDALLGPGASFDPLSVLAEPSDFLGPVKKFQACIERRRRIKHKFRLLLRLAPVFFFSCIAGLVGTALLFVYFTKIYQSTAFFFAAWSIAGGSGITLLVAFAVYTHTENYLSNAEVLTLTIEDDD